MYSAGPKSGTTTANTVGSAGKTSKWQPLTTMDPSPVAENDPFSLGDSDEEKDATVITLKDDGPGKDGDKPDGEAKAEDEQVKKATGEAMTESIGTDAK